ncbi:MAG: ABC transporter permease [Lachnospira sp.]
MNKYLALFVIRIRQMMNAFPKAAAGTVMFVILLSVGTMGIKISSETASQSEDMMVVAICLPQDEGGILDESRYIKAAADYVASLEAVKNVGRFEYCNDENTALKKLKNGEYAAVLVIPENYIGTIISGGENPARVIFAGSGANISSALFQEMIEAAASDVGSAQIGIYSVDDVIREYFNSIPMILKADVELNKEYMSYAFDRSVYFTTEYINDKGLSVVQSFVCAGIMVIIAMGGVMCVNVLKPDGKDFADSLKQKGISTGASYVSKVLGVTTILYIIYGTIYLLVALSAMRFTGVGKIITAVDGFYEYTLQGARRAFTNIGLGLIRLFGAILINSSMAGIIYYLAAGKQGREGRGSGDNTGSVSAILVLCIVYIVMFAASGCIVDSTLMPEWIRTAGKILPTRWMYDLIKGIIV